jgi:3-oxoacid CoA-transferase subunit A/glutaconate CoA-transferase subunit A
MKVLQEGTGELVGWHDPDAHRAWVLENKSRERTDKTMSVSDAVARFMKDGDFLAMGGFGHIRVSMAAIYEMIRQGRRHLTVAGKTAVHDIDVLIGAGCVDKVEVAYAFGHELRGLSPAGRRNVESGRCKVVAEITNAGYQWRFLAGAMGIPFMPVRSMLGTDTLAKSSAKVVEDPFTGKPICLVPAAYPDVSFIHVPRCDRFGNAQIDGITIMDRELARASRRLVITTEEIVDESVIQARPDHTVIPYFLVDAVCHVPFGSHPCQMPNQYYFDEGHIGMWMKVAKTDEGVKEYLDRYVFGVKDFDEYLERCGGISMVNRLRKIEQYQLPDHE